jgi:hypothetical protein
LNEESRWIVQPGVAGTVIGALGRGKKTLRDIE